jgi:nitroimidazol reductase NimA-like FMN-containing flavoprotein (pyridoxamine 5'-phosphate oxidase superfamily)
VSATEESAEDIPADHTGDLARRITRRRTELGLSIEEVAAKTGVDPGYLRYFEESTGGRLSTGTMLLLALALDCTPEDLYGGRVDRPAGRGRAGRHPELTALSKEQCEAHLRAGGVGRLVFESARGTVAHPMNYVVSEGDVIVSTTTEQAVSLGGHGRVGFQIDRVDESMGEGWSVLVTGTTRLVDDPDEVAALAALGLAPWAGGDRHTLVRIRPDEVTGRLIAQSTSPS